ncbi:unnamed protein product [Orchesella dallaii]|uniref:SEC7 domain-containing protein n=1 Tax=Orchesella dallaii TaxID=48710 RepID=A0ABP1PSR0_9HEXA
MCKFRKRRSCSFLLSSKRFLMTVIHRPCKECRKKLETDPLIPPGTTSSSVEDVVESNNNNDIQSPETIHKDVKGDMGNTYSSSEMTRLSSSSSSSSSASSSPVLFTTAQSQNNNNTSLGHGNHQFHHGRRPQHVDSVEESGDPTVTERRYGGPPARDAALVIQRAYRRYSMVKEFQRIKTERRLSRRINNNAAGAAGSNACSICIDLHEPHSSHPTSAEVDALEDEFEDASLTSSSNELPPLPISDCAEVTEVDVEVDHAIVSSANHHQHHHHAEDISSTSSTHVHHHGQHYVSHYHQQQHHHQQHNLSSRSHQQQLHYASNSVVGQVSSNSATASSSRLSHHQQQRHFSSSHQAAAAHPHSHLQHIPPSHSQSQFPSSHQQKQSNKSQQPIQLSTNSSAPNLVVTSTNLSSASSSSLGQAPHNGGLVPGVVPLVPSSNVSPNISSSSASTHLSQSSPPVSVDKQRTPKNLSDGEAEILRKRLYRVGLNLFNKKPEVGVAYLVKKKFLEGTPPHVARFLISRKGLSKQMIGEYLANLQSPFSMSCLEHFASEIDLASMPIDLALRRFQTFLRMPGEAQKIERVMESFSRRYGVCNPQVVSQFRNGADTVFVLAFAIVMLNTDLHTPHLKQDRRMKLEDFIKNLRGIDDGGDIDREILVGIYERIKQSEFKTGSDHVTQVMKVQQTIVGKKPNLALPHRRLVCYCRLYEVSDINKREKPGSHQREVFLFNDILVLTKIFHKKRNAVTYSFRQSYPLSGITLAMFSNQHFDHGLSLKRGDTVLLNLNARNEHDRAKFTEDLREAIAESDEMARIESLSKENRDRDSGVDVGKIKRFSNSLLDISDQCKPIRRGSCGSLDSGMSVSFHSDEIHQQHHQNQPLGPASGGNNSQSSHAHSHSHHHHSHHHSHLQQTSSSNNSSNCSASSQISHN